ncbi:MAG: hypothetical protein ACTSUE_26440 [Promethearchaeota archaeon]
MEIFDPLKKRSLIYYTTQYATKNIRLSLITFAFFFLLVFFLFLQITGIESTGYSEEVGRGQVLVRHIRSLRRLQGFSTSQVVVIVEKNYGGPIWGMNHAAEVSRAGLTNVVFARRHQNRSEPGHQPGVVTTSGNKPEMMESLYRLLEMRGLRFSKNLVSVWDSKRNATEMVQEFIEQIQGFRVRISKDPKDPMKQAKRELSGKIGPAGRDDLVDCAAMCIYWPKFLANDFL